ncbi:MAG: PSD1 and planctomycete cytochrome C domain-containing protein [Planctomycetaceae bacterium]
MFKAPTFLSVLLIFVLGHASYAVDFQRDIRPILAANCYTCHGPDEAAREAGLRLDEFAGATEDLGGYQAVTPGDRLQSELWTRITSTDPDVRMPPHGAHEPLSAAEIAKLGQWIDEGAEYQQHWSFVPPVRSAVPDVTRPAACNSPLDRFIEAGIERAGLVASSPADRHSLVRRLYLDLIGLPPTPAQCDQFVNDQSPVAYERLVDSLLASPDYAERWARPWLDLARYADTNGYEKDRPRTIWPYRDWVLEAINADMPYDEFSIKQIAGDMLPNGSHQDIVATGFHRNTMLNEEGGIDPLEYRFHAMTDRVATTGLVWMGLTTGCAQCHTHKYDPITHRDYYAMFALLNNADEPELEVEAGPLATQRGQLEDEVRHAEDEWIESNLGSAADKTATMAVAYRQWIETTSAAASDWQIIRPSELESSSPSLRLLNDGSVLASGDITKREVYTFRFDPLPANANRQLTAIRLEALPDESLPAKGPGMAYYEGRRGDFFLSELIMRSRDEPIPLRAASHSYGKLSIGSGSADAVNVIDGEGSTGWSTSGAEGESHRWVANLNKPLSSEEPFEIQLVFERHFAAPLGRLRFAVTSKGTDSLALSIDDRQEAYLLSRRASPTHQDASNEQDLKRKFFQTADAAKAEYARIDKLRERIPDAVRTLVMRERHENPRITHRHHRGEYLQPKEVIEPGIVDLFAPLTDAMPTNRLEFAKWLVSDGNPLVGRVAVDRAWRQFFERGIVDTAGDYGTQSQPPSHPELLDYLACDLAEGDWSIKRLHREIVLSAAYQRSSNRVAEVSQRDPDNRLLAVGPRRRLEAERIRDSMLAASHSLTRRLGGPSVYPPQPESVTALAYGKESWPTSQGGDRFRRSVYTFAKRTAPFAAYTVFDGPTGESCLPRRHSSNTPLQSLTLMNDAMYFELAEAMASDVLRSRPQASEATIATELFRRLVTRMPQAEEIEQILTFYRHPAQQSQSAQHAWVLVARALMNLDEAITSP